MIVRVEVQKVDITMLKYFMHKANLQNENPALFKLINDKAREEPKFEGSWTKQQFVDFFVGNQQRREPPSIDEMVTMFEMLDTERTGFIKKEEISKHLDMLKELRTEGFKLDHFVKKVEESQAQGPQQKTAEQYQ